MKKIEYKTYKKPTDFARFEQGNTTIHIVSSGGLVKKHGMRTGRGYIPMGDCTETPDCKQCLQGNVPKQKWMWIAYIKDTKEVKILDVGAMLGDAICKIAQEKNKDPQEFDIIVSKVGEGLRTKYTAEIGEIKSLTEQEIVQIKNAKQFLIKKYFTDSQSSQKPLAKAIEGEVINNDEVEKGIEEMEKNK